MLLDHSVFADHLVLQVWFVGQAPALQAVPELCDQGTIRVPAVAVQLHGCTNEEKLERAPFLQLYFLH